MLSKQVIDWVLLFEHHISHQSQHYNLIFIKIKIEESISKMESNLFVMDVWVLFLYKKSQQLIYPAHYYRYHIYHQNLSKNLQAKDTLIFLVLRRQLCQTCLWWMFFNLCFIIKTNRWFILRTFINSIGATKTFFTVYDESTYMNQYRTLSDKKKWLIKLA